MFIKTRFAPSPSGKLHIGNIRTALFSWLYAKKNKGNFILRIENTDKSRTTQESIDHIQSSLKWLGLDWDNDVIFQSDRISLYKDFIKSMLLNKTAYKCFCTKERLEKIRKEQILKNEKPRYDGKCRDCSEQHKPGERSYVIRFKAPKSGNVKFMDKIKGEIIINNSELDDIILFRSDGLPTYNFAVTVDDFDMKISHVIRGDDHLTNTATQINLFKAISCEHPIYAHAPLILNTNGSVLSKRDNMSSVDNYKDIGILADALLNYLIRLGWSYGNKEIFSISEMIKLFNFKSISKSPSIINFEKLLWLNHHYLKNYPNSLLINEIKPFFIKHNIDIGIMPNFEKLLDTQKKRYKTLEDIVGNSAYFFNDIKLESSKIIDGMDNKVLLLLISELKQIIHWKENEIKQVIDNIVKNTDLKFSVIVQPLRYLLTASNISPSISVTMELIGKEKTLKRLNYALNLLLSKK